MKKITIQLNQKYKSFNNGFTATFEGDLIILSGVNGSGKSQLIDIISQRESHGSKKSINVNVLLNQAKITRNDILRRSFKENVNVPELTPAGTETVKSHKDQAWNAYHNYRLNYENENLWDYKESCEYAKKILLSKFDGQKFSSGQILQTEFTETLPNDFVWKSDDIFTNFIGELFFNYSTELYDAQAEAGRNGKPFDISVFATPPWKQLNELFSDLNFEYRFKDEYHIVKGFQLNEQPSLYQIKGDGVIDENERRRLADLSDGEKAIISLSFASLSGVKQENRKVLLLDEFDANFNPSLTEIFYKIIDKYFVSNDILVVIATHSPTTISLAPESALFYEVFKPNTDSSRIQNVQKNDYAELQIANKSFYDKIANQSARLIELKKENEKFNQVQQAGKPALVVEDKYDQIYKIAWLKLNDLSYSNSEEDINLKFCSNAPFQIYGFESAGSVAGLSRSTNMEFYRDKKIVCLFDFDGEGCEQFYLLKRGKGWDDNILGDFSVGFYKKRSDHPFFYSLLLPIPDSLRNRVSDIREGKFTSFVAIENLLPEKFLVDQGLCVTEKVLDREYLRVKEDKKPELWKELYNLDKEAFRNYTPLFTKLSELFGTG